MLARPRPSVHRGYGGFLRAAPYLVAGLTLYAVFVIYPLIEAVINSFQNANGVTAATWAGLSNYRHLFSGDPVFGTALRNTVIWTGLSLIVPNVLALLLAVALNGRVAGRVALRTVFFAPAVLATIIVAMTWNLFYDPTVGLFNSVLGDVGLHGLIRPWLGDPGIAIFSVFAASVWQSTGISMVLLLAGLQSVSRELVEAAEIDGASRLAVLRHVELPAIRPVLAILAVLSVLNSLKAFDLVYAMTQGGPGYSSQVLASYAWMQAIQNRDFGLGSAVAVVLLAMAIAAMVPYVRWIAKEERG